MRLERIIGLILPEGVLWEEVEVPKEKVFKVALKNSLSPQEVKVGDPCRTCAPGRFRRGHRLDCSLLKVVFWAISIA